MRNLEPQCCIKRSDLAPVSNLTHMGCRYKKFEPRDLDSSNIISLARNTESSHTSVIVIPNGQKSYGTVHTAAR